MNEILTIFNIGLSVLILKKITNQKPTKIKNRIILDTSAIMDGRIVEVVDSGFIPGEVLVPRFVVAELQLLADKSDHLKRERARFGLEVIKELQENRLTTVKLISDDIPEESGVDEKLVKLSKKLSAMLCTTDYNLLKVAEIEGLVVLNINQLAQNLRPTYLPGEQADLKIVQKGQDKTQSIGYLTDGTMVVVEKAGNMLGKVVRIEFTRNLQTSAGKMMFAKLITKRSSKR